MNNFIDQIRVNWAMGGARRLIIGIFGAVVGCCVLSSCIGILGGGNRPSATPTAAVAARATDAPKPVAVVPTVDVQATVNAAVAATNAARPTNTPAPTNTPRPTNTPVPTATPNPSGVYFDEIASISSGISPELTEFVRLVETASDKPALFADSEWRKKIFAQIAILKAYAERINNVKAPPALAAVDKYYKLAGRDLDDSMTLYRRGIEDINAVTITQAGVKMRGVATNLTLAKVEIDKVAK